MIAIQRLAAALIEQDGFEVLPDETPVFLDKDNCSYELIVTSELDRRFTLADLRAIVKEAGL